MTRRIVKQVVAGLIAIAASLPASAATVTIVNGDPAGVGFNDTTAAAPVGGNTGTTLGQQRMIALQAAANIWGASLTSSITIKILVDWSALSCSAGSATLGSTGAAEVWHNFANAPVTNHWYGKALADKLAGADLDSASEDIDATFNVNLGNAGCLTGVHFYLGLDNNHGSSIDLISVALHEFAHGLGFQTFTNGSTGALDAGFPSIWDDFLQDNVTNKTWTQMTASERVASAISGRLIWNGSNVTAAVPQVLTGGFDAGGRALMYTPGTYQPGSSVSHYTTAASPNQIMEPSINSDLVHQVAPPKDLTLPLLMDIGWGAGASQAPDLTVTKSHTGNFTQGQVGATYTLTVHNSGTGSTNAMVTVTDPMPSGLTATAMSGSGWNCTQPAGPCSRSDVLTAGSNYPAITVTVNVGLSATNLTNTASVSGGGETNTANDSGSDPTTILATAGPDLTISKTHSGNFTQGQVGATYTITVHNGGGSPTTASVTVAEQVPAGLTAAAMSGTGWSCTQPAGPCFRGDALGAGSNYPAITFTANVSASATNLTNTVTVSGGGETITNNDTATDPTTVTLTTGPDLTITKTHLGNFSQGQTGAAYTITVRNSGTGSTSGTVSVSDSVPFGLTAVGISGSGWNCTQPAGPCSRGDVLSASSNYPAITATMSVAANAPVTVTNVATVSGGGDTNVNNNSASDPTVVNQGTSSDLSIGVSHAGSFSPGQAGATYTITVMNSGAGPTSGIVMVTDAVPAGLTPTGIAGSGWSCTQPAGPCSRSDTALAGAGYPALTLTVNVALNAPASVTNSATVSGGGDANTGNNTASDVTTIAAAPVITSTSPNPVLGSTATQPLFINGTGFQNGATVRLTGPGGQFNLQGGQVSFFNSTQLSILFSFGLASGSWAAEVINPGGQSSSPVSFPVIAPGTTITIALPHIVFGGAWYTALYFSNTTSAAASVQVTFIGDDGSPLNVPLVGIGSVSSRTVNLNPGATVALEALNGGTQADGWVEATIPAGVDGYAVFRQVVAGRADQEAVVPFTPETSQTADLTYDDIQLTTSIAFLNPSNQQANCFITAFAADGTQVGQAVVPLNARSKQATTLKTLQNLSGIAGKRGRVVFSVPNGAVSVIGLRFGGEAFTSIPVTHR